MSEPQPDKTPGQFSWNELVTHDVEAAKKFYSEMFGWTCEDIPMPDGTYYFFKNGERPAGGMMQIQPEWGDIPPHWMSYVTVSNIKEALETATAAGASILQGEKEVGDGGCMGKLALIKDPTGAIISFWQFAPDS